VLRKSAAYYVFIASLLGVIATNIHTFGIAGSTEIWVGNLMSLVVAAFLIWYSKQAESKGWISQEQQPLKQLSSDVEFPLFRIFQFLYNRKCR